MWKLKLPLCENYMNDRKAMEALHSLFVTLYMGRRGCYVEGAPEQSLPRPEPCLWLLFTQSIKLFGEDMGVYRSSNSSQALSILLNKSICI